MKSNRLITVVLVVIFALVFFVNTAFCDCTGIIVGKDATVDGSILIARNEDFSGNWAKHIIVVPGEIYEAEELIKSATGFICPQPAVTYKYVSAQDWDPAQGRFNEGGINEYQVGVSSTTTARQNDKAKEVDPKIKTGIGENIITALVLERAKTAKEGVGLVGDLVEEYGSSEIFGMAIGDPNEAWLLEVGGGHHWVAVRVPDNSYVVEANALRIGEIDLSDTANFMGSADLITFAETHGLYDSASGEPFDFAKAYGTAADLAVRNYRRVWGGQHFFTPSAELDPEAKRYPLFLIPDEKIKPQRVMSFLRYHYQGTDYDTETPAGQDERGIGISRTLESHVLQLRSWLPNPIGGVMWLSMSAPRTSVYVPYYSGITEVPLAYQLGTDEYDSKSAYWTFRTITSVVFTDFSEMAKDVQPVWEAFESREFVWQPIIEKIAVELHDQDKTLAIDFLTNYSNGLALNALDKAFILGKNLLSKIAGEAKGAY